MKYLNAADWDVKAHIIIFYMYTRVPLAISLIIHPHR